MSGRDPAIPSEVSAAAGPVAADVPAQVAIHIPSTQVRLDHSANQGKVKPLTIIRGSVQPATIDVLDQEGEPEDLSSFGRAALSIEDGIGAVLLARDTATDVAGVSPTVKQLTKAGSSWVVRVSQAEADALPLGRYVADIAMEHATLGWIHTEPFYVNVRDGFADALP